MKEEKTPKTIRTAETGPGVSCIETINDIAVCLRNSGLPESRSTVIIPMMIVRRLECDLRETKDCVLDLVKKEPSISAVRLFRAAGRGFYNTCDRSLAEISGDGPEAASGLIKYINGFSSNVREMLADFDLPSSIRKLDRSGCLCDVIRLIAEIDMSPSRYDSFKLGEMLEMAMSVQ